MLSRDSLLGHVWQEVRMTVSSMGRCAGAGGRSMSPNPDDSNWEDPDWSLQLWQERLLRSMLDVKSEMLHLQVRPSPDAAILCSKSNHLFLGYFDPTILIDKRITEYFLG